MHFSNIISKKMGSFFDISRPLMGEYICPWANGELGAMVDIYESDTLRFIDYYYEKSSDGEYQNIRIKHLTEEERKQCPIVAEGIIVYWMKWCCDNALQYDAAQLFDDYYEKNYNNYERWQKRFFDYWKRKHLVPLEFAQKHLTDEMRRIVKSKKLSQYLPENDMERINDLARNYIEYVKDKVNQLKSNTIGIDMNIFTEGHNVPKIVEELKKIDKTGFGPKQFVVIAKEFFISISWLTDTSDVNVLKWMKHNKIVDVQATKLQNVPKHNDKERMLDTLRSIFQRRNAHYIWEDRQEFYMPGVEKINQG